MADNSLWPVVIGGALAMAGGAITSGMALLSKSIESATDRKKRRAEKFEQLVELIFQYEHWLTCLRDIEAYGDVGKVELSPMAKIESIAAVHFPEFNDSIAILSQGALKFTVWIYAAKGKRLAGQTNLNEGLMEAYTPYNDARTELLKAMREFAKTEFR